MEDFKFIDNNPKYIDNISGGTHLIRTPITIIDGLHTRDVLGLTNNEFRKFMKKKRRDKNRKKRGW